MDLLLESVSPALHFVQLGVEAIDSANQAIE